MYRINEIFQSLQGEGYFTGTSAVFIRFSGCNLQCSFCDTHHEDGIMMSLHQIIDEVKQFPAAKIIVLTGGEPSIWIDSDLIDALKASTGKIITIETNGTHKLPDGIDWVTLSPKSAFEGGNLQPCLLEKCNELKVVYVGQDLDQYSNIKTEHRFLQPCYCDDIAERQRNISLTVSAVLTHPEWRLSLQTHRILGIR